MELQALLVLCGVGVAGVAVLLLMGLFSTSGTSYEEAIAQQRKATSELLALADSKTKNKKSNKKVNKKAKKEKNKESAVATGSEPESEAPAESGLEDDGGSGKHHVEFCPPVVVEVPTDIPPNIKIRKRGKDPKVKPILLNKEDPSCINDASNLTDTNSTAGANHFEEMLPKDEFALMHSTMLGEKVSEMKEEVVEKKENKVAKQVKSGAKTAAKVATSDAAVKEASREHVEPPKEQRKAKKTEKKVAEEVASVVEEIVPPLNVPQPSELTTEKLLKQALVSQPPAASPSVSKNKKKKAEPNVLSLIANEGGGVAVNELVRVVKEASLSRTEIQILTDTLLNKQHDPLPEHSEWTEGPNDPIQKLKKQLADKEKALADEIEASQALHAKLKELRVNLNAERGRATAASRSAEQAASAVRAELHTSQVRLQRLVEENHVLAQDKLMLQAKLKEDGDAQAQMEMHIQRLSESEATLVQQLQVLQAEAAARALEAGQARCELVAARDSLIMAQQHAADLAQQLQEANRAYAELEQQRQCALHADQLAQQELRQAQQRQADLQNDVQRLTERAQEAEKNVEKIKEDYEKEKQELSNEVSSLREQLASRDTELAELKVMKAAPTQNGLLSSPSDNEQAKAAELAKVESLVEGLRGELRAAQLSNAEQKEQLSALQLQLEQYKQKNNETKTVEILNNEVINILRSVCPSAAPTQEIGKEWFKTYAENLRNELHNKESAKTQIETELTQRIVEKENEKKRVESDLKKRVAEAEAAKQQLQEEMKKRLLEKENERKKLESEMQNKLLETESAKKHVEDVQSPVSNSRLNELVAQNEQLQALVDKYKTIIDDTEGVLSRLQQNVSAEEAKWAKQLSEKQRELDELRLTTVQQMQSKIDELEIELQKSQRNNHNASFAEAERLTEEKLLSTLSSKVDADTLNGPLQARLERK
ncbi:kinectin-like isoform X3 [Leptidea sinapis]|uniref:kinectin-like isoform X3 n=1 Tax=Leptidea sinapis TaxID=189913 RepID=UPI0021C3BCF5|nr:kinectin-like isoform X3 [Leptidea sinapis]